MTLLNPVSFRRLSFSLLWLVCSATFPVPSAAADIHDLKVSFPVNGKVGDMQDYTSAMGFSLAVDLQDIKYAGRVTRVLLESKQSKKLTVWLALRDLKVTIRRTAISGRRHQASCGPLTVVMGDRREAWLAFDVDQETNGEQIGLNIEETRFGFTDDNWSVGTPSWVRASGIGMTQGRVVDGLQSGLSGRRAEFEQQIIDIAPSMFDKVATHVEQHLLEKTWKHETVAVKTADSSTPLSRTPQASDEGIK